MNNWKPYAALIALCFLWGTTYLAIKIGVQHFPVFLFSGLRFIIAGGVIVAGFALNKKTVWPSKKEIINIAISGSLIFVGGNLLLCIAEITVTSGLSALINTAFPLWIVIITRLWNPVEKAPLLAIAGMIIGFAGQIMIFYEQLFQLQNTAYTFGIILLVAGVINGSLGSVHMKKFKVATNPVLTGGLQMLIGGCVTTIIGLSRNELYSMHSNAEGWYAMTYLIIAGSIFGYSLFVYALNSLPAALVSVYAYVNPIVALFLGWLLLNESVSKSTIAAMMVTLSGVFIVKMGMSKKIYKDSN